MGRHTLRVWAVSALFAFGVVSLTASSAIPPTFQQLVDNATDIFVGSVARRESRWVDTSWGAVIFTYVTFDIQESLKGTARGQTTLQFRGGTVGNVTLRISDMPEFRVGDHDLLFVGDRAAVSPLVGFMHGRFRIEHDTSGNIDRVRTNDGRPLVSTSSLGRSNSAATTSATQVPSPATAVGLSLPTLRSEILTRLRTRTR